MGLGIGAGTVIAIYFLWYCYCSNSSEGNASNGKVNPGRYTVEGDLDIMDIHSTYKAHKYHGPLKDHGHHHMVDTMKTQMSKKAALDLGIKAKEVYTNRPPVPGSAAWHLSRSNGTNEVDSSYLKGDSSMRAPDTMQSPGSVVWHRDKMGSPKSPSRLPSLPSSPPSRSPTSP